MKTIILSFLLGIFSFSVWSQEGCTNPTACNYDPSASVNDGSCVMPGCSDPYAYNYNPNNLCDGGFCDYNNIHHSMQMFYSIIPQNCEATAMNLQIQNISPDWVNSAVMRFHSLDGDHDFTQELFRFSNYFFEFEVSGSVTFETYVSPELGYITLNSDAVIVLEGFEPIVETFGDVAICNNYAGDGNVYWIYTTSQSSEQETFWNTSEPNVFYISEDMTSYQICIGSVNGICTVCTDPVFVTGVSEFSDPKDDFLILGNGSSVSGIRLPEKGRIEIFSIDGKILQSFLSEKEVFPKLEPGMYLVRVGGKTKKLVVN